MTLDWCLTSNDENGQTVRPWVSTGACGSGFQGVTVAQTGNAACGQSSFLTNDNTDYYILFQRPSPVVATSFAFSLVSSDTCAGATEIVDPENFSTTASLASATVDVDVPRCTESRIPVGPGVWFTIAGQENVIVTASTCESTDIGTQIAVFRGPCDAPECVVGNDSYEECASRSQVE